MAPQSPWNKSKQQTTKVTDASFPGLVKSPAGPSSTQSPYQEIQNDELIALSSIYGEDFHREEETSVAWKKAEPSFTIRIKSSDEDIYLDLHVVLTATYPRSPPLLTIKNEDVLRDITKHKVQQVIKNLPKELVNEEQAMVMDIVVAIQEVLEEEAVAKAAGLEMPSLEEERLEKEEAAAKLAKAQEQEKEKKRQAKVIEEERMLQAMTQLEQERQRQSAKAARRSRISESKDLEVSLVEEDDESLKEIIKFDRPITLIDEKNNPRHFLAVTGKYLIREGPAADCFTVRPILTGARSQLLVLKQTSLKMPSKDGGRFKIQMENLEKQLQSLKKVSGGHANILKLYDYKLNKDDRNKESIERIWTVYVLSEYANKGSLEECLEIAGDLGVDKVRAWTIELLEALGYLHNNGIIHRDLHAANIMLIRSPTGNFTAKIGDAGFQRYLHDMKDVKYGEKLAYAKSTSWIPPEHLNVTKRVYSQKSDIWDFGIIFLQMIFGLNVLKRYESPERLMEGSHLSQQLEEIVKKLFKTDPKKRPRAFDLTSSEFLATDAPIKANRPSYTLRRGSVPSLFGLSRGREDSMTQYRQESQYEREFNELGPLGKGGFGAVVKARKKTDGNVYAIKKISQKSTASLTEVLKEVRVLSQLSHPFVVRYYNSWTEEVRVEASDTEGSTTAAGDSSNAISPGTGLNVEFGYSTGGVDFISSSGYPAIEFAYGSDEEAVVFEDDDDQGQDEDEDTEGDDLDNSSSGSAHTETNPKQNLAPALRSERSSVRVQRTSTMLFIQMEFCENRTLRDLIKNNLWRDAEEVWRLFRQIVDALAYVHKMNVVHRDLKPENVFIDGSSDIRLGDFGLATASQFNITDNATAATDPHNMTTSIGTASYVAPEVRSSVGNYNNKVDMYSLGIIFFEMCYHPVVGMERATVLTGLRNPNPIFPSDFNIKQYASQGEIIRSLLSHNPDCRPGASALLKSGKLPVPMGDELIRQTIAGMADPESAYFRTMLTSLFSEKNDAIKDGLWDGQNWPYAHSTLGDFIMRSIVKDQLKYIFKRHGALETPRPGILPYLSQSDDVVKLLDHNGMVVQLPYDLEVPYARMIAKYPVVLKSFAFGNVYRNRKQGQPLVHSQVNFDIVSDSLDLSLKEAEALKVIDEILAEFPCFGNTKMCFHVNHADLLSLILQFCRVEEGHRPAAARELSYLNFKGKTWLKTKPDLKAIGLSEASLDDLRAFDFRDSPMKAFGRLKTIFEGTAYYEKAAPVIAHLQEVVSFAERLGTKTQIFVNPLTCVNASHYRGGIIFACHYDTKQRLIFAGGGRYDSVVRQFRDKDGKVVADRHVVGFGIEWENLAGYMSAHQRKSSSKPFLKKGAEELRGVWAMKKCDVLVASFDAQVLRTTGLDILQQLWSSDISAELACDARNPDDLLLKYKDNQHTWIVIIKQDGVVKIKSMGQKDVPDVDVPISQLVGWIKAELRDRDHREGNYERAKHARHAIQGEGSIAKTSTQEVKVLSAQAKSKKGNRQNVVEQAQVRAATLAQTFLEGPILAIETTDQVLDLIKTTRLSDPDTWKKVVQSVSNSERRYIDDVQNELKTMAYNKRDVTNAFIYNFRTSTCIYYDLSS